MKNRSLSQQASLEPLPPSAAIEFFKDKVILPAKEFYDLEAWARARAFTVSHVTKAEVLGDISNAIDKAIENGETLATFRDSLDDIMQKRGWEGTSPWHEETIFRTNIQTAYSAGKFSQLDGHSDKFVGQFDAILDDATTETCRELNGKIYPLDSPFWDMYMPPLHFNCRSTVRPVYNGEVEERGLYVSDKLPPGSVKPSDGFGNNLNKVPFNPDLSGLPKELADKVEHDIKSNANR